MTIIIVNIPSCSRRSADRETYRWCCARAACCTRRSWTTITRRKWRFRWAWWWTRCSRTSSGCTCRRRTPKRGTYRTEAACRSASCRRRKRPGRRAGRPSRTCSPDRWATVGVAAATGAEASSAAATFTTKTTTTTTTMTTKTWPRCCFGVARAADGSCTGLRRRRRRRRRRRSGDPLPPPLGPSPDTDTCDGDDRIIYYVNVFIIVNIRHSPRSKSQWRQNRGPTPGSGVKARKWCHARSHNIRPV